METCGASFIIYTYSMTNPTNYLAAETSNMVSCGHVIYSCFLPCPLFLHPVALLTTISASAFLNVLSRISFSQIFVPVLIQS
jgi:hypothetical protein